MNKRNIQILIGCIVLMLVLAACDVSTTTASCAFVVGDGSKDRKVSDVVYPGEIKPTNLIDKVLRYVPCNSRNFIINDGKVKNANGEKVGDRDVLIKAATKSGVPVTIAARALWTLNQERPAMEAFYSVCLKYNCASDEDKSGEANFSTPGWNGMLAENFGPAMDAAARDAAIKASDDIWQKHDPEQYKALGDAMSEVFAEKVRQNLGFDLDLFCGSGNSAWENPDKPGQGKFTCSPVRIIVDDVQRVAVQQDENTVGAQSLNAQRLSNAQAIYGPNASFWLGLQDTIESCKKSAATCIFNIGGSNDASVAVPVIYPTPTAIPTPTVKPQ